MLNRLVQHQSIIPILELKSIYTSLLGTGINTINDLDNDEDLMQALRNEETAANAKGYSAIRLTCALPLTVLKDRFLYHKFLSEINTTKRIDIRSYTATITMESVKSGDHYNIYFTFLVREKDIEKATSTLLEVVKHASEMNNYSYHADAIQDELCVSVENDKDIEHRNIARYAIMDSMVPRYKTDEQLDILRSIKHRITTMVKPKYEPLEMNLGDVKP